MQVSEDLRANTVHPDQNTTVGPVLPSAYANEINGIDEESWNSQTTLPRIQESLHENMVPERGSSTYFTLSDRDSLESPYIIQTPLRIQSATLVEEFFMDTQRMNPQPLAPLISNLTETRSDDDPRYFENHNIILREPLPNMPSNLYHEENDATTVCNSTVPSNVTLDGNNTSAGPSHLNLDTDECPTRDTSVDKFKVSVDVRYLSDLTNRIKGAFMQKKSPCDQGRCHNYRERWEQHNLMYHQGNPPVELCQHQQHQYSRHPKLFQTTASETMHVARVSSAHATQTVQPSKRDRCIEFQVPKHSFANQVHNTSNLMIKFTKSTSMADFNSYADRAIATSIINSILAETSDSCVEYQNDMGNRIEVVANRSEVNLRNSTSFSDSTKSFGYPWGSEDRNADELSDNLKTADTFVTPKQKSYEEQLRVEIYKWLDDVPVFPDQQETAKESREYLVKILLQRLVENSGRVKDDLYGESIKKFVENCVCELPMWCPGDKNDQIIFKQRLSESLLNRICLVNEKVFDANHINFDVRISEILKWPDENLFGYASTSKAQASNFGHFEGKGIEEIISLHVTRWIRDDVIRIYPNYTKCEFVNLLLKSLEPFLHQGSNITFATLSKHIFEILDELPVTICSDTDKALRLYRLSEDLADVIRQHGTLYDRDVMSKEDSFSNQKSTISLNEFKNIMKFEVKVCLQRFRIDCVQDMVDDITEILVQDFDTVRSRIKSEEPIIALYKLLERTGLTKDELSAVVLNLISCIRILPVVYDRMQICQGNGLRIDSSPISNTVVVFRNQPEEKTVKKNKPNSSRPHSSTTTNLETELTSRGQLRENMPQQSTPKRDRNEISFAPDFSSISIDENLPLTYKMPRLSPEATAYLQAIEIEIEKWIDSVPAMQFNTSEDLKFKRTMIKDLAADVLDRARFRQLHSGNASDFEDLEHMRFILFRWVFRISDVHAFEMDDQFDNRLLQLVHALQKVPVPDLTTPHLGNRRDMKVAIGQQPTGVDILEDEISIFLDEHPQHIFVDKSKGSRNMLIRELATHVREHIVNEQNPEEKIEAEVDEWLEKVVHPETNTTEMKILLKERITRVPAKVFQPHIKTQMEQDIEQGIKEGLVWLQKQNFYQQCTTEEKNEQQLRTVAMVKTLLDLSRLLPRGIVTPDEKSKQILTEMVDHLKYFPIGNHQRMGDKYSFEQMRQIAIELVKYLAACDKINKQARSQTTSSQTAEQVNAWIQTIPIKITTTEVKAKFEAEKANLIASIDNLKKLKHEQPANVHENLLKSEIKNFLQACPLDERVPNTEKGRVEKAQELIDVMKVNLSSEDESRVLTSRRLSNPASRPPCVCPTSEDQKLKEFLKENMQKFQTCDSIAKEALTNRLIIQFQNINLRPCQMESCKLSCKALTETDQQNQSVNMTRFNQELVIIKSITEWLKDLPLVEDFYSPGNQDRSKVISELAEKMYNAFVSPEPFDNHYLYHMILDWMSKLPLKSEFQKPVVLDAMSQALKNRIERDLGQYNADHPHRFQEQNQIASSSNANQSIESAKEQDSRSDGQKLEDFVENFMTMNRDIDISDEVIRDAYAYKLLQALKIAIKQLKTPVNDKYELYEAMGQVPMPGEASVLRYTREMRLDKEVKEWMSLLPTVPADTKEQKWRDKQCAILAKFLAGVHEAQIHNPWHPYQKELVSAITEILNHVLEPGHKEEYMELTNGLLRRQLAIAEEYYPKTQPGFTESQNLTDFDRSAALHKHYTHQEESIDYGNFSGNVPHSSSKADLHTSRVTRTHKPLDLLFQAIEDWSNEVPIEGDEETKKTLRENLVQAVMRRVGKLNMDPNIYNDNLLYIASLTDDIDELLDGLPQNSTLHTNKDRLKTKLVKYISEANVVLKNINAGENYKKKLEDNIQASLPKPTNREEKAAIDLIKTAVAEEFILEKYQNGDCDLKSQYEDKVISDLSNVMNASVFTKSDMSDIHNSIISELEAVPAPNKEAITLEIEEIKTKNIIAEWFEGLPLISPENNQEVLDRDRIQSLLAKRLHEIEKNESEREFHMTLIIEKWLHKLRFHDGQEKFISDMTKNLITRLRTTNVSRQATLKNYDDSFRRLTNAEIEREERLMISTRPATSNTTNICASNQQIEDVPNKNCTEVIFERVQRWCQQLPLEATRPEHEERNKEYKTRLATKILFKIGELNRDDLIFHDEMLYSEELSEVLDKIISSLIRNEGLKRNKKFIIRNLVQDIVEIRPCIKEEKDRHHYKQQLYNTVAQVAKQPQNISREQKALLENFQEEVVDDFIEYNYHRDESGKQSFKEKILNESQRYLSATGKPGPIITDELFQELAKVPVPTDAAVSEEIQEIRLKQQISNWIEELPLPRADALEVQHRNKIKGVLAKRLNEIEKHGTSCNSQQKMKGEIAKYMNKINENISSEALMENVNRLTERLNRTAPERRTRVQRIPTMQSNQGFQASDFFFRPIPSATSPAPNQRYNQTCPQKRSVQTGQTTPDFPYIGSGSPSADQPCVPASRDGSTQTAPLLPCPGPFARSAHTGMNEGYSENAVLCPSYSDLEAWANCQHSRQEYQQEDGHFVACPYFINEEECPAGLDVRLSKARNSEGFMNRMKGLVTKTSSRSMVGRKSHCMCLDTEGLLSVVPCPIHEKAVWKHPGTCNARCTRY